MSKKKIKKIILLGFIVVLLTQCASIKDKTTVLSFPFVENAKFLSKVADQAIITKIVGKKGIQAKLSEYITSFSISVFDNNASVVAIETPKINRFGRIVVMKKMKGKSLDDTNRYWSVINNDMFYIVDIEYAYMFLLTTGMSLDQVKNIRFIREFPKELRMLKITQYSNKKFWFTGNTSIFQEYFSDYKLGLGKGALVINEPSLTQEDVISLSFALSYKGSRVEFTTLKLVLPFLFKALGTYNSLLPEIMFDSGVVIINNVYLANEVANIFLNETINMLMQ